MGLLSSDIASILAGPRARQEVPGGTDYILVGIGCADPRPPFHPSPLTLTSVCLCPTASPSVKTHTHESGTMASGYPLDILPDVSQISPRQGSQNFSAMSDYVDRLSQPAKVTNAGSIVP